MEVVGLYGFRLAARQVIQVFLLWHWPVHWPLALPPSQGHVPDSVNVPFYQQIQGW